MSFARFFVGLTAAAQLAFMILEMFFWTFVASRLPKPKLSPGCVQETKVLGANQGLYNGFLAAGLLWSLYAPGQFVKLALFFVICVIAAAAYGAWSVNKHLLWIQGLLPFLALIGLIF